MKKLLTLCLLVIATMTLSAKTIKEFVVTTTPQMSCQNCENKIKKNLRFEKGVTNITTDLENQVVVVTYDADKTNETNLTNAFAKLDYKVAPTEKKAADSAGKTCSKTGKACSKEGGKSCSKEAGKACSKDGKSCSKEGGKSCSKEAGKACSKGGKSCCKEGNGEKKCDGTGCKKGTDCCKNKEKK